MADDVRHAAIIVTIHLLMRDGLSYALDEDVVPCTPSHPDVNPADVEPLRTSRAGEWRALIGVGYLLLGLPECSVQGTDAALTVEGDHDFPGHNIACESVEQANIGEVRTPYLIDSRHIHPEQPVG